MSRAGTEPFETVRAALEAVTIAWVDRYGYDAVRLDWFEDEGKLEVHHTWRIDDDNDDHVLTVPMVGADYVATMRAAMVEIADRQAQWAGWLATPSGVRRRRVLAAILRAALRYGERLERAEAELKRQRRNARNLRDRSARWEKRAATERQVVP